MYYDSLGRLTTQFDNMGAAVDYRYDSRGNMVAVADSNGPTSGSTRSLYRRSTDFTEPVVCNGYGNVTLNTYDYKGRKIKEERLLTATGRGDGVNIGRDTEGQADTLPTLDTSQAADGKITTTYDFHDNGQLWGIADDNGNATLWAYNALGQRKSETKGMSIAPQLADRDDSDTTIQWTYNTNGLAATMTKEDGTIHTYSYDDAGRLTQIAISNAPAAVGGTTLGRSGSSFEYCSLGSWPVTEDPVRRPRTRQQFN